MIFYIRLFVGHFLHKLHALVSPTKEIAKRNQLHATKIAEANKPKPIPFKDMDSYLEDIKNAKDLTGGAINVCNALKVLAAKDKTPARVKTLTKLHYKGDRFVSKEMRINVATHQNKRWYNSKDIEVESHKLDIVALVEEFITSMGMDGWACMPDATIQIFNYHDLATASFARHIEQQCKGTDKQGTLTVEIVLHVAGQSNEAKETNVRGITTIALSISAQVTGNPELTSAYIVYFNRVGSTETTAKA